MIACEEGHYRLTEYLLSKGANFHYINAQGVNPLYFILKNGRWHLLAQLQNSRIFHQLLLSQPANNISPLSPSSFMRSSSSRDKQLKGTRGTNKPSAENNINNNSQDSIPISLRIESNTAAERLLKEKCLQRDKYFFRNLVEAQGNYIPFIYSSIHNLTFSSIPFYIPQSNLISER